jgi:hypothetical protein
LFTPNSFHYLLSSNIIFQNFSIIIFTSFSLSLSLEFYHFFVSLSSLNLDKKLQQKSFQNSLSQAIPSRRFSAAAALGYLCLPHLGLHPADPGCNTLMFILRNLTKVFSLNLWTMSLGLISLIKIESSPLKEIMENTWFHKLRFNL